MAEEIPYTDTSSVKEAEHETNSALSSSVDMAIPSAWKDTIEGPPTQQQQRWMAAATFAPVVDVPPAGDVSPLPSVTADAILGRRDVVTPPITHHTAVVTGSSGATTPQLSPSMMTSLRGSSSPSHSQVSVGSAALLNPSLMNAVLSSSHKHYDLTPVTRNTSDLYCDTKGVNTTAAGIETMTITPSSQEGYLHGEHLAFPSDLSRASVSSGPAMPPLQPVNYRRNSSGNLGRDASVEDETDPSSFLQMDSIPTGLFRNEIEIPNEPVQFPSARKYYSFTTREQYEEACRYADDSDDDFYVPSDSDDDMVPGKGLLPRGLTPYAPRSRPANFDIEQLPEEELKRIFITRGGGENDEPRAREESAAGAAIPLEQRIPSLRMANHLLNESTTSISYTDNEDEDSVLRLAPRNENDDAASWSSLGSNHRMVDEEEDEVFAAQLRRHRKRKQRKNEEVLEWLQSATESANIAEAASSKFLTNQPLYKGVALHRPVSLPVQVAAPPPPHNEN